MKKNHGCFFWAIAAFSILSITALPGKSLAQEFGDELFDYLHFHPDYLGTGIKAGSFMLHPQMSLDEAYNNNIYATRGGKISDAITDARPSIVAESDWENHALRFSADGDAGRYASHTKEDYNDYDVKADGRLDITRGNYLWGGLNYLKQHEARGTPDDLNNGVKPVVYDEALGRVGFTHDVGRLSTTVGTEVRKFEYNNGYTSGGTVIEQDARNRMEYGAGLRFDYELIPGYKAFVKGNGNIIDYETPALLGNRNSHGFSADVGTAVEVTGKVRGEVYLGYLAQEYDNSTFKTIDGIDAGGKLIWSVTGLTTVEGGMLRSVNETIFPGAYGYIDTAAFANIQHDLTRDIRLNARADYHSYKYEGISRTDNVPTLSAGARYLLNKNIEARADYTYQERDSDAPNSNYQQNLAKVSLSLGL